MRQDSTAAVDLRRKSLYKHPLFAITCVRRKEGHGKSLEYGHNINVIAAMLQLLLLIHSFIILVLGIKPTVAATAYQWQSPLGSTSPGDWQKYVRSPSNRVVRPARVIADYTQGNVTNPDGLLLPGKGLTILTRAAPATSSATYAYGARPSDIPPTIVVDFGQNIAGILSINFGGAYNTTPGLPGIRLAFSETLEYLTDVSDFSRSYNVSLESLNV